MRVKPKTTDLTTLAKAARKHTQKLIRSFADLRTMKATSTARYGVLLLLAASFATAGTPDRAAWKAAWYRARRGDTYPTGLVAYYSFDSVSGDTVFDTFGDNDGTAVGSPLFGTAYGKYLDGVNFVAASSQRISIANESNFDFERTSAFSVSAWFASQDTGTDGVWHIVSKQPSTGSAVNGWTTRVWHGKLEVALLADASAGKLILLRTTADTFDNAQWYHLVWTYDGSSVGSGVEIYVNGELEPSSVLVDNLTASILNNVNVHIGSRDGGTQPFSGNIDEVAIWNRALSSNEITGLYNNNAGRFYTP